ncbi:toll/interleukin-1 receptor domain-containing protein [Haloferula sp. A504]|uniref:toll/interleukin-1 receptor domain-containing protein n=1 Tax=Haloferula sp. A504 TaxID=3373601 RepID=UPI0031CB0757|nr:toll/interleukin-1 receptor domain-containing protein [Verrucomicrobiaceae bacterium E54]
MKPNIFISYRRTRNNKDTPALVSGIAEGLRKKFGKKNVFLDKTSIPPASKFPRVIEKKIRSSSLVIVIIDPGWVHTLKERLKADSVDWHRKEVEIALATGNPVMPVMVDGAELPESRDLPPSLEELTTSHAVKFPEGFESGIRDLIKDIDRALNSEAGRRSQIPLAAVVLIVLAGISALWVYYEKNQAVENRSGDGSTKMDPSIQRVEITRPDDGGRASFRFASGQGARVTVEGIAYGISEAGAILLTVTAADGIERPQYGGARIHPDETGKWSKEVQVGNASFPPNVGDHFVLKSYIVPKSDFKRYQSAARSGVYAWPPEDNPSVSPVSSLSFFLTD